MMAPHRSGMSVETYIERVAQAVDDHGETPSFSFLCAATTTTSAFIAFLTERVREALERMPDEVRADAAVIFSAHSLPVRTLDDGSQRCKYCDCDDSCRYRDGLQETADLVAGRLGLADHLIAWQSAGRTADPWWGPLVEDVIRPARARRSPCGARVQRRASWPTISRCSTTSTSRPRRSPRKPASRSPARACPTPTPSTSTCSPRSCATTSRWYRRGEQARRAAGGGRRRRGHRPLRRVSPHIMPRSTSWWSKPVRRRRQAAHRDRSATSSFPRAPIRSWPASRGPWPCARSSASNSRRRVRPGPTCGPTPVSCRCSRTRRSASPATSATCSAGPGCPGRASAGRRRTSCVARAAATTTSRSGRCCAAASATRRPTSRWRPLLAGLHAGDVDRLSVQATFPDLAAWERAQGSLFRGSQAHVEARAPIAARPDVRAPPRRGRPAPRRARRTPGRTACAPGRPPPRPAPAA